MKIRIKQFLQFEEPSMSIPKKARMDNSIVFGANIAHEEWICVDVDCLWGDVLTDDLTRFIIDDIDVRLFEIRHAKQALVKRGMIHIQSQVEEDFFDVDGQR